MWKGLCVPIKVFSDGGRGGKPFLCVSISLPLLVGSFHALLWGHTWSFHKPGFQFKEATDRREQGTETDLWAEAESGTMDLPLEGSQGPKGSGASHRPERSGSTWNLCTEDYVP